MSKQAEWLQVVMNITAPMTPGDLRKEVIALPGIRPEGPNANNPPLQWRVGSPSVF
jgi:hypothetical protein